MAGTRWKLVVRQARPAEIRIGTLKAAIGREHGVAVTDKGPDTIRTAFLARVAHRAAAGAGAELTASNVGNEATFFKAFGESYQDYVAWRADLSGIEHPSNRGETDNLAANLVAVMELVLQVTAHRPAVIAIRLALIYIENQHIIDTDDPFPLKTHAPIVVEVEGGVRLFHERVMSGLLEEVHQRRLTN